MMSSPTPATRKAADTTASVDGPPLEDPCSASSLSLARSPDGIGFATGAAMAGPPDVPIPFAPARGAWAVVAGSPASDVGCCEARSAASPGDGAVGATAAAGAPADGADDAAGEAAADEAVDGARPAPVSGPAAPDDAAARTCP